MFISLDFSPSLSKNQKYTAVPFYNPKVKRQSARIVKTYSYTQEFQKCVYIVKQNMIKNNFYADKDDIIIIDAFCVMTDRRSDSHNLIDAIMDILESAIGVNDRNFMIGSWTWKLKRKKTQKNLIARSRLSTSQKGSVFLKVRKAKLEESLSLMMEKNFTLNLQPSEITELNQLIKDI